MNPRLSSMSSAATTLVLAAILSTLPATGQNIVSLGFGPTGISSDGTTVVGEKSVTLSPGEFASDAYRWTIDGPEFLYRSEAMSPEASVSADGTIIVGHIQGENDLRHSALRWIGGTIDMLPMAGALAVSVNGRIAGYEHIYDENEGWIYYAAVLDQGNVTRLGRGMATAVSDDGSFVVWSNGETGAVQLWPSGQHIGSNLTIRRVSADGSTLVGWNASGAVRWKDGLLESLGSGWPTGVSGDGSVIVGSLVNGPFIWTREWGMRDLATALTKTHGIDLEGWTLLTVSDISADGKVLVGWGIDPRGVRDGWRIDLTPTVTDLRFHSGSIRRDAFPNVFVRLSKGEAVLESVHTDFEGTYALTPRDDDGGLTLTLTEDDVWGIRRQWTDLSGEEIDRSARLPATLMKELDDHLEKLEARGYDADSVRALFRPYEHWADTLFTDRPEVDSALVRLITASVALDGMYDNTGPVANEFATSMAEVIGFTLNMVKGLRNAQTPGVPVPANRFQQEAEALLVKTVINSLTDPILATLPESPAVWRMTFSASQAALLSAMQAAIQGNQVTPKAMILAAAKTAGGAVGEEILMYAFKELTQVDLNLAAVRADAFAFDGNITQAWTQALEATAENFTASDAAASFSQLTRETASTIGDWSEVIGAVPRVVAMARILTVAQLSGYVASIGRTGYRYYQTIDKDVPAVFDVSFGNTIASKSGGQLVAAAATRSLDPQDVNDAVSAYLAHLDAAMDVANSDLDQFANRLPDVSAAALEAADAITVVRYSVLSAAPGIDDDIEEFEAAHRHLIQSVVDAGLSHGAFAALTLGVLTGESTVAELAAQADTVRIRFTSVVDHVATMNERIADVSAPAFLGVVSTWTTADSVRAGEDYEVNATIRNVGGLPAHDVTVELVPSGNLVVREPAVLNLGTLGNGEGVTRSWWVASSDTADWSSYEVLVHSSAGTGLPAVALVNVHDAAPTSAENGLPAEVPGSFALEQNYPNPFNPTTSIAYVLPEATHVRLSVYNVLGQEVARLVDHSHHAGRHEVRWDAENMPSGVYAYSIEAGRFRETRWMVLLR